MTSSPPTTPSTVTVAPVSVKPAKFDATAPGAWFAILEAQFLIAGMKNSATKFYTALSHLPPQTVASISESIITSADYDQLKKAVIGHHESTKPELFDQFLRNTTLSGRPSHHLQEMRRIASKVGVTDDFLRHRFQQALPGNIAPIIASQPSLDLDAVGKLADELVSLFPRDDVCAIKNTHNHHPLISHPSTPQTQNSNYRKPDLTLTPFSDGQRSKLCRSHIFLRRRPNIVAHGAGGQISDIAKSSNLEAILRLHHRKTKKALDQRGDR